MTGGPGAAVSSSVTVVAGANGGCGASLLAGAIALASARRGVGTWLVELDLDRGDRADAWGLPRDRTLSDLAVVASELEPRHLEQAAQPGPEGVRVLNAPPEPGTAGAWTGGAIMRLMEVARAAAGAGGRVIVDAGAGLSAAARAAAGDADAVIVVCSPTVAGVRRARRIVGALPDRGVGGRCGLVVARGSGPQELGAGAVARAASALVLGELPWSPAEADRLAAGRWPSGRRRRLAAAVDDLASGPR